MTKATQATKAGKEKTEVLTWRLLSVAFLYPNEAWHKRMGTLLNDLVIATPDSIRGKQSHKKAILLYGTFQKTSLDEFQREYHRLFSSAGMVPLDVALYLTENPFEQAKKAADLGGFYKAFGLEVGEGQRIDSWPACAELAGYLWLKVFYAKDRGWDEKTKIARGAVRTLARNFLETPLRGITKRLGNYATLDFYPQAAHLAKEAIDESVK